MRLSPGTLWLSGALACGLVLGGAGGALWRRGPFSPTARPIETRPATVQQTASAAIETPPAPSGSSTASSTVPENLHRLTPADPNFDAVIRTALDLDDEDDRVLQLHDVFEALSPADFPAAFLKGKTLGGKREDYFTALGATWADRDPQAAAAFGSEHNGYNKDDPFLRSVLAQWIATDPPVAASWVSSLPKSATRNELTGTLIAEMHDKDPRAAARLLRTPGFHLSHDWMRYLSTSTFGAWAESDPQQAASAALELKSPAGREALDSVAKSWAKKSPAAAAAWARSIPNAAIRTSLSSDIGLTLAETDPNAAIAFSREMSDPLTKRQVLGSAISRLVSTDPSAVSAQI
jgi:hypothetical protein